jgi:hypothetical protein
MHCNLLLNHETNISHSSASKGIGTIHTAHPNHGWLDKLELGQGSQDTRVPYYSNSRTCNIMDDPTE